MKIPKQLKDINFKLKGNWELCDECHGETLISTCCDFEVNADKNGYFKCANCNKFCKTNICYECMGTGRIWEEFDTFNMTKSDYMRSISLLKKMERYKDAKNSYYEMLNNPYIPVFLTLKEHIIFEANDIVKEIMN